MRSICGILHFIIRSDRNVFTKSHQPFARLFLNPNCRFLQSSSGQYPHPVQKRLPGDCRHGNVADHRTVSRGAGAAESHRSCATAYGRGEDWMLWMNVKSRYVVCCCTKKQIEAHFILCSTGLTVRGFHHFLLYPSVWVGRCSILLVKTMSLRWSLSCGAVLLVCIC